MEEGQQQWFERWQEGRIGFHQAEINPWLTQYARELRADTVLVPLCGKSLDMRYLASQGKEVLGVELVPQAVSEFFAENHLPVQHSQEGPFSVYRTKSEQITIYQGDFFQFSSLFESFRPCDIYDRAALIALGPKLRPSYAQHILQLLNSRMLLITLEYDQEAMAGPPYSVTSQEVQQLYGSCRIQKLGTEPAPRGDMLCYQHLYLIEK